MQGLSFYDQWIVKRQPAFYDLSAVFVMASVAGSE